MCKFLNSPNITRGSIDSWMGSEVARIRYKDDNNKIIEEKFPRSILAKRVANTLDASYHSAEDNKKYLNKYDAPLKKLLDYKVGNLPIPYFILMNTAQVIIDYFDGIKS